MGRGMGLGAIACAYIIFGLGELIMGEGYPGYAGRMPAGIIGSCAWPNCDGCRNDGGDIGWLLRVLSK